MAEPTLSNPGIRSVQAATIRKQIASSSPRSPAPRGRAKARAQLQEAKENRRDLTVTAPFDGTVITRTAEPGEVVQAGTAIVTLLDLSKVYLRGFVPEGQIGHVKVGPAGARLSRLQSATSRSMPMFGASIRRPPSRRKTPTFATTA